MKFFSCIFSLKSVSSSLMSFYLLIIYLQYFKISFSKPPILLPQNSSIVYSYSLNLLYYLYNSCNQQSSAVMFEEIGTQCKERIDDKLEFSLVVRKEYFVLRVCSRVDCSSLTQAEGIYLSLGQQKFMIFIQYYKPAMNQNQFQINKNKSFLLITKFFPKSQKKVQNSVDQLQVCDDSIGGWLSSIIKVIIIMLSKEIMKPVVNYIDAYSQHHVYREDDHQYRTASYFSISSNNFLFDNYDHGTEYLKQKYHITKKLFRYFNKRNFLFKRFQEGIHLDQESWYSVIPEDVSLYLRQKFKDKNIKKIFQPFCGIGGIAVHLCDSFEEYIVNDIDQNKIKMLKHNLGVYKKNTSRLQFRNADFLDIQPFKTDLLVICPPWGGISIDNYATKPLDEIMEPKLSEILIHAKKFQSEILLQMPKNTNLQNLIKIFHQIQLKTIFTIQKIMTNQKCSQLFIYLGTENFININSARLYDTLYRDLNKSEKNDKKVIKNMMSLDSNVLLKEVFTAKYPNKIIYFIN